MLAGGGVQGRGNFHIPQRVAKPSAVDVLAGAETGHESQRDSPSRAACLPALGSMTQWNPSPPGLAPPHEGWFLKAQVQGLGGRHTVLPEGLLGTPPPFSGLWVTEGFPIRAAGRESRPRAPEKPAPPVPTTA